jgi:hypothetical protein
MPITATTNSSRSIPALREIFSKQNIAAIVTPMYKVDEKGRILDSKRTLIMVQAEEELIKSGLEYRLYDFSRFSDPKADQGQCWQIHISGFPNTWKRDQAVNFLKSFLEPVFTGWYLSLPTIRETNTIRGYGVITFKDKSISEDQIRQMKLALHHKALCDTQGSVVLPNNHLRVSWQVEKMSKKSNKTASASASAFAPDTTVMMATTVVASSSSNTVSSEMPSVSF